MRYWWCAAVLALTAGAAAGQDMPLSQVLLPGEGWAVALRDCKSARGLASDGRGNVYVADPDGMQIWKIDKDGKAAVFARTQDPAVGLACGPDDLLYASQPSSGRVVTIDAACTTVVSHKLAVENLVVTRAGQLYCTAPDEKAVYLVTPGGKGERRKVAADFAAPGALALWVDGGTLVVGDAGDRHLAAFRVQKNGDLDARDRYYSLWARPKQPSDNAGLTVDSAGRLYATSREGVQVFDPTGRLSGLVLSPEPAALGGMAFGGADLDRLYIACGGKVYVRKVQAKGVKAVEKTGP